MGPSLGDELVRLGDRLSAVAATAEDVSFNDPLSALIDAAEEVGQTWSGSSIGYHALVYYDAFEAPPPGAHFSAEWGFMGATMGTRGDWREYQHDDVIAEINRRAGGVDLTQAGSQSKDATRLVHDAQDDLISLLRAELGRNDDEHLRSILDKVIEMKPLDYDSCLRFQLPDGRVMTRDAVAMNQGVRSAPHQEVIARVVAIRSPFSVAGDLAASCRRAARHLTRVGGSVAPSEEDRRAGGRVVIGHGRSPLWRELKDFVEDRLKLPTDEFNRVSTAGVATSVRLQEMVESSELALLVATAEDESADGDLVARQNVIHEIGLFQGHLGFARAIVLLEEGCEEFSNIHGLGQIRFPRGNIAACFEEVRKVAEREGLV